jgi:thymidylate kinase
MKGRLICFIGIDGAGKTTLATRPMVSAYSWQSVINRLQGYYRELVDG